MQNQDDRNQVTMFRKKAQSPEPEERRELPIDLDEFLRPYIPVACQKTQRTAVESAVAHA